MRNRFLQLRDGCNRKQCEKAASLFVQVNFFEGHVGVIANEPSLMGEKGLVYAQKVC
jgi:hypothetical protein